MIRGGSTPAADRGTALPSFVRRRAGDDLWSLRDRREAADGEATPVEAVMTPELVGVDVSARLPEVCRVMLERGVHRVLVLEDRAVIGIISTTDVIRALHETWRSRRGATKRATKRAKLASGAARTISAKCSIAPKCRGSSASVRHRSRTHSSSRPSR